MVLWLQHAKINSYDTLIEFTFGMADNKQGLAQQQHVQAFLSQGKASLS
jgi:hypothetical protein